MGTSKKPQFKQLTLDRMEKVLSNLEQGLGLTKAVTKASLTLPTFYKWITIKRNKNRYYKALDASSALVEEALYKTAVNEGNVQAQKYWLNNRTGPRKKKAERWQDKVVNENTNTDTKQSQGVLDLTKLSPKELKTLKGLHDKAAI